MTEYEYNQPYFVKSYSPLKPTFPNDHRHRKKNDVDKQTSVSAMCEHLLVGEYKNQDGHQLQAEKLTSPCDLFYDRGLQRDGGYTMYTPVSEVQVSNITHCKASYNLPCSLKTQQCVHSAFDRPKKECRCTISNCNDKANRKIVSDQLVEDKNNRPNIIPQGFDPYTARLNGVTRPDQTEKKYGEIPNKIAKRTKRHEKKMCSKKQRYARDIHHKSRPEADLKGEWRRQVLNNQARIRKDQVEKDWEPASSPTSPVHQNHRIICQEIYQNNVPERKQNMNQDFCMSSNASGHGDGCQDWKAVTSLRNRKSEEPGNKRLTEEHSTEVCNRKTFSPSYQESSNMPMNYSSTTQSLPWRIHKKMLKNDITRRDIESSCNNYNRPLRSPTENKCANLHATNGERLFEKSVVLNTPHELARVPWKCTIWEEGFPSSLSQTIPQSMTWSCEMYSHTNLCEHDVGMASPDQYRSYIKARNLEKVTEKTTKDFSCQETMSNEGEQKKVSCAVTQTDEIMIPATTSINHMALNTIEINKEKGRNNVLSPEPKALDADNKCSTPSLRHRSNAKSQPSNTKNENPKGKQNTSLRNAKKAANVSGIYTTVNDASNGSDFKMKQNVFGTSMAVAEHCLNVENVPKVRFEPVDRKRCVNNNDIPDIKGSEVPTFVGEIIGDCQEVAAGPRTNLHHPIKKAKDTVERVQGVQIVRAENAMVNDTTHDIIIQSDQGSSPLYYYPEEEHSVKRCSGNGTQQLRLFDTIEKKGKTEILNSNCKGKVRNEHRKKTVNAMKDYEHYKRGRIKYEEEMAIRGCEFEIEELKFKKQPNYEPAVKHVLEETSNITINTQNNISSLNQIDRENGTVLLSDSTNSRVDSPLSNESTSEEDLKTDACLSYPGDYYKKNTIPPGDPGDITPCLTCSRSSSKDSLSRSRSNKTKTVKKRYSNRKDDSFVKKSHKTIKKRSSSSPTKTGFRSGSSFSGETLNKKNKKLTKKQRRKQSRSNENSVQKSYSNPLEEKASTKMESSSSSSSISRMSQTKSKKKEQSNKTLQNTTMNSSPSSPKAAHGSRALRSHVKNKYNVTAPELLTYVDVTPKYNTHVFNKNPQSPSSVECEGHGNTDYVLKQRGTNPSKGDPFNSLNTAQLNLSIMRLYKEIHRLQQQLNLNQDDSIKLSKVEKLTRNSPSSESITRTIACSSVCKSYPESTDCNLTERGFDTTSAQSSPEWIKSTRVHPEEEKALKLCRLQKRPNSLCFSMSPQGNSAPPIICRADSPVKNLKKKLIPRDTSLNRVARPIYTKLAGPCLKCWRQSNSNHTRANRKHNGPSPGNGPSDTGCSWEEDEREDDEDDMDVIANLSTSTNAEKNEACEPEMALTSRANCCRPVKTVGNCQGDNRGRQPGLGINLSSFQSYTQAFNEDNASYPSTKLSNRCCDDDLHLLLTSSSPPKEQIATEEHQDNAIVNSTTRTDESRSARSFVCNSSWLTTPDQQPDERGSFELPTGEALGNLTRLVGPRQNIDKTSTNQNSSVAVRAENLSLDGNNSKLDEPPGENDMRVEDKIPTSVTCGKLKIFGETREKTLAFYKASILKDGSFSEIKLVHPSLATNNQSNQMKDSDNKMKKGEDSNKTSEKAVQVNTQFVNERHEERFRDKTKSAGLSRVKQDERAVKSLWSEKKKPKIPYTVPRRLERQKTSNGSLPEERSSFKTSNENIVAHIKENITSVRPYPQNTNEYPPVSSSTDQKQKYDSPVDYIIELLTDKPCNVTENKRSPPKLQTVYGTSSFFANQYEESFSIRENNSPDCSRRKVYEPNRAYSEFEPSPRGELNSPNLLSKFFQENVQQISDYIQSFRENGFSNKEQADQMRHSGRDTHSQNNFRNEYQRYNSSNNSYGLGGLENVNEQNVDDNNAHALMEESAKDNRQHHANSFKTMSQNIQEQETDPVQNQRGLKKEESPGFKATDAFTVNNNSNQGTGSTQKFYDFNGARESVEASPTLYHKSKQTDDCYFGPKKMSYIHMRKSKNRPKAEKLNDRRFHDELSNIPLECLQNLNLVHSVKQSFFKALQSDLYFGQNETGDHACPPKPHLRSYVKSGLKTVTPNGAIEKGERKLEETILCEYISGRKQRNRENDGATNIRKETLSPKKESQVSGSNQNSRQGQKNKNGARHDVKFHASPNTSEVSNVCPKSSHFRVDANNENNPLLSYNKPNVCSLENCGPIVQNMTAQHNLAGASYAVDGISRQMAVGTEDSNKAISHYSDAIRTGHWRARTSSPPFCEAFSGFKNPTEEVGRYSTVKRIYPHYHRNSENRTGIGKIVGDSIGPSSEEPKNHLGLIPRVGFDQSDMDGNQQDAPQGSILSSFEKMMQDKRPCYAEHCQHKTKETKFKNVKKPYCHQISSDQHCYIQSNHDADGNNSSNEIMDSSQVSRMLTPQCLHVCQDTHGDNNNLCNEKRVQEQIMMPVQCKMMLLVGNGSRTLLDSFDSHDASKLENPEHESDTYVAKLTNSHELKMNPEHFLIQNCSDNLHPEEHVDPVEHDERELENSQFENVSDLHNMSMAKHSLDSSFFNLSLNVTGDADDIIDEDNFFDLKNNESQQIPCKDNNQGGPDCAGKGDCDEADHSVNIDDVGVSEAGSHETLQCSQASDLAERVDASVNNEAPCDEVFNLSCSSSNSSCDSVDTSHCLDSCESEKSCSDSCGSCSNSDGKDEAVSDADNK
ncbi:hypothetical protein BgiBS90_020111 [Biomphalaria glabrata]|nr:hypothetical protein BgiBS90_020111 [Biomphalaria glabrata]